MSRSLPALLATLIALLGASATAGAATPQIPLDSRSPWPVMRHDPRNTGASPIVARYGGQRPWAFRTGRGIFSTPLIGGDGTVYIGSADTNFYALRPDGRLRWRIKTGGIIDASGVLSAFDSRLGSAPLTFGSGDDRLYHVTTPSHGKPRILWTFRASVPPVAGQTVDWWEGSLALGPGGNIYAGNTGGTAYTLSPSGRVVWKFTSGGSMWTSPSFAPDGSTFWGSLDLNVYKLSATGHPLWQTFTPGFVVSSPAIGSDGTVYVGSFDSKLYALDPATGAPRWTYATSDHIYASPALGTDAAGHTTTIYIASTDGSVYALTPDGHLRWRYDTGDPIRSSPVLGTAPGGGDGHGRRQILYVGSSNGKLYALDATTGRRRWSFDTTPTNPLLRDRNDLNASPALGRTGIYIAGEHGYVDYVPYDYCLHRRDVRCSTSPAQEFGDSLDRVFPVSAGGSTLGTTALRGVSPATVLNLRLIVRRHGTTLNAAILNPNRVVSVTPRVAVSVQESGDGHFLFITPRGLLRPGTTYRIHVAGAYTDNGVHMGNFNPAGPVAGHFAQTITVRTAGSLPPRRRALPLSVGRSRVSALTITRLAVPMPAFLPSVNQIGFDSYDWIASTIARSGSRVLLWVIGATRDARGVERVDPHSAFSFPVAGRYSGGAVTLSSPSVPLTFSFGLVPLRQFNIRGTLQPDLHFRPGVSLYTETVCSKVPHYGAELKFTGICNPSDVLAASGTLISSAYRGSAAARPAGVGVASLRLVRPGAGRDGSVSAVLRGGGLPLARGHVASILLTSATGLAPVSLDYKAQTKVSVGSGGRITGVHVTLPAGMTLPSRIRAYVIVDAYPVKTALL